MTRTCAQCGKDFEARSSRAKFCSSTCRARKSEGAAPRDAEPSEAAPQPTTGAQESSVHAALLEAARESSPLGIAALILARRLDASASETPQAVAALVRELRATLVEALDGAGQAADTVDEVGARRDAKLAAVSGGA